MRVLALGGLVGPVLFACVVVSAAALRPGYSHLDQFISELGATGTERAALMNYAGFVASGLLLAAFGVGLARGPRRAGLGLLGAVLVVLFGIGVATSGVFSCDVGCPRMGGSAENAIHDGLAPPTFLSAILAAGVLGLHFRRVPGWRALGVASIAASVVALGFLAALVGSLETRELTGLWQRLLLATLFTWCAVVGVAVFRRDGVG